MKTIFIVISRGFIVRNILRSGTLSRLLQHDVQVVLLFARSRDKEFPDSIRKEFNNPRIHIEVLPLDGVKQPSLRDKIYSRFCHVVPYLVFSSSTWAYLKSGTKKQLHRNIIWAYLQAAVYAPLSKLSWLKGLVRMIEQHVFYEDTYASYFDRYQPDLVFSTSIVTKYDMDFMKAAKKRGIPTVSMCKGWDNISKILLRVLPDVMVVQSPMLKRDMVRTQAYDEDKIEVVGFPPFDWYSRPDIILPREEFFKKLGLPADRQLIFFGSEGAWASEDHRLAETAARWVESDSLARPCSMLVRPHFSDIHCGRFDGLKNRPFIKVDTNYSLSDFFIDNWNPDVNETEFFVNCIYHSSMMIMTISTLALDAACLDKPIIAIGYNAIFNKRGDDVTWDQYQTDHFRAVLDTGALTVVRSDTEFQRAINAILEGKDNTKKARERLRQDICYRVDGLSSQRLADVIISRMNSI